MRTTEHEMVISVTQGRITRTEIVDGGKAVKIYSISEKSNIQTGNTNINNEVSNYVISKKCDTIGIVHNLDELFPIVEVSKLSLEDRFLQYRPIGEEESKLKKSIIRGIKSGLKDFRHPIMDPSEDEYGNILFMKGNKPATEHSEAWWNAKAKEIIPSKNSRLGDEQQYDAFLGILIKYLVEEKRYEISEAWKSVCGDSIDLACCGCSNDEQYKLEPTGSKQIGKWCDLGNVHKLIKKYKVEGYVAAGCCKSSVLFRALSNKNRTTFNKFVGWIVCDV